jgi:hypothetical protein
MLGAQAPNTKHQIPNKFQTELFWSFEIGIWDLFGVWDLDIGI